MRIVSLVVCALLFGAQAVPAQTPADSEVESAISAGLGNAAVEPLILGFGGSEDPIVVGYVFPPLTRVSLAARAARDQGRTFTRVDVTPAMLEPVVYVVVPSRERMAAVRIDEPPVQAERLIALPRRAASLDEGTSVAAAPADTKLFVPGDPHGRVFGLPMSPGWADRQFVVLFPEPALNTSGETGRDIRCVITPARASR